MLRNARSPYQKKGKKREKRREVPTHLIQWLSARVKKK
jgi:hypothetical protein